jgi:hypothetical protein
MSRPSGNRAAWPARHGAAGNWPTRNGAAGRRPARHRARAAPASSVRVLGGDRTRPVVPPRRLSRHAGSRRPVKAIRVRRHPAPVRQPVLRAGRPAIRPGPGIGHGPAIRCGVGAWRSGVRCAILRSGARCRPVWCRPVWCRPVRCRPVRPCPLRTAVAQAVDRPAAGPGPAIWLRPAAGREAAAGRRAAVVGSARREPARLARGRASWLAQTLPGWHLARSAQQLSVVAVLDVYGQARSGRMVLLVVGGGQVANIGWVAAAAFSLAPGRTVRVTAEAGVATFHQLPPGPGVQPRRGTFVLTS